MAASREWICVRLATYENAEEAEFLKTIFIGRSGELENTTFALLAADGETPLSRAGRGPAWLIGERRGPEARPSAEAKTRFATLLEKKAGTATKNIRALPLGLDLRRALNVAACDRQPLVVVFGRSAKRREGAIERLAPLCWSEAHVGRFQYATAEEAAELASLEGAPAGEAVMVVAPGDYGIDGRVLAHVPLGASKARLAGLLSKVTESYDPGARDKRAHLRKGRREAIRWETAIPVTDPGPAGHGPRGERPPRPRRRDRDR